MAGTKKAEEEDGYIKADEDRYKKRLRQVQIRPRWTSTKRPQQKRPRCMGTKANEDRYGKAQIDMKSTKYSVINRIR